MRIGNLAYKLLKQVEDERIRITCGHQRSLYIKKGYEINPLTGDKIYSSSETYSVFITFEENVYSIEGGEGGKKIRYDAVANISKLESDRFNGINIGDMISIPDDQEDIDPEYQYIIENIEQNKNDQDTRSSRVIGYKLILKRSTDQKPEERL